MFFIFKSFLQKPGNNCGTDTKLPDHLMIRPQSDKGIKLFLAGLKAYAEK
jgi:hypothetical protein